MEMTRDQLIHRLVTVAQLQRELFQLPLSQPVAIPVRREIAELLSLQDRMDLLNRSGIKVVESD